MATQTSSEQGRMKFKPVNYDATDVPPEAPPGEWTAKAKCKVQPTDKDQLPMIIVAWKIKSAADADQEQFIGSEVADFLVFFPKGHRGERMGKLKILRVCELVDFPPEDIPKTIKSPDDLDEFIAAIESDEHTIYTAMRFNKQRNEDTVNVFYDPPKTKSSAAAPEVEEGEAEEEEEADPDEPEEEPAEQEAEPARAAASNGGGGKGKKKNRR